MLVKTKYFGEVDLDDDKILTFENGIIGFEDLKKFTLIYNNENESGKSIIWLQSMENAAVALPLISPFAVMPDYNPVVEDEVLQDLGPMEEESTIIFVTLTIPSDITKMTTNLKAPIVINAETKKGCQVIAENSDYIVKYNIYDIIQQMKEKKGE